MFLIEDRHLGAIHQVFTWEDPRNAGYKGKVIEGVILDYDMDAVHAWPDGARRPEACVGRATDNSKQYKVFKYGSERQSAGYEPVQGTALVFGSWSDYLKLRLDPPNPDQIDDAQWYEYLDKIDEGARLRRKQVSAPSSPVGKGRDAVAAWVAKTHFIADSGIREVWYLPRGAALDEIRLLELNDRLPTSENGFEPIEFGLDVDGAPYRLVVADITTHQMEQIKQDPSRLPLGWSLEGTETWRRGA